MRSTVNESCLRLFYRRSLTPRVDGDWRRQGCRPMLAGILLLLSIGGLQGCHMSASVDGSAPLLSNAHFMNAWKAYLHCRSSAEPDEIHSDLQQLSHLAQDEVGRRAVSPLVPATLKFLFAAPLSRLAVDPQAMATACALHGGHVAQSAGRPELTVELFTAVLAAQRGASYAYYAAEVRRKFHRME